MPELNEQIIEIRQLRKEIAEQDRALYSSKLELHKTESLLAHLEKEETIAGKKEGLDELRTALGNLEARLQALNAPLDQTGVVFEKSAEADRTLAYLNSKVLVLDGQLTETKRLLKETARAGNSDRLLLEQLKNESERLNEVLAETTSLCETAKRERENLREQQEDAVVRQDRISAEKATLKTEIESLEGRIGVMLSAETKDPREAEAAKARLTENGARSAAHFAKLEDDLRKKIGGIYEGRGPADLISELRDDIPILLFPVRLETRFMTVDGALQLWLRIYPDDISIHTHETLLTDKEAAEGVDYWKQMFRAAKEPDGPKAELLKKAAWSRVAALFGGERSAWIAQQTKPNNWPEKPADMNNEGDLDFPAFDLGKTHAWTRAPRTKVLPDKFVVLLYDGNVLLRQEVGRPVPDQLFVGPDPLDAQSSFKTSTGDKPKLTFGESFDWMSDFEKAVEKGMGFKIPLTRDQVTRGIDKILVLGLRLSADSTDGKEALEELIDNHHYSPKGFSLVPQGTSTNNTENGSGYTKNDPFYSTGYHVETGAPMFAEDDDCDGRNLADALGIDYRPLQYVSNSGGADYKQAVMMNKALYPATIGYFLETMLEPVLDEDALDLVRGFFVNHVTGRGPLPAIRIGNQPYGILLTSDFGKWTWSEKRSPVDYPFLSTLSTVLKGFQNIWDDLVKDLMHVGKSGKDPSAVLMNILGLQAGSVSFYQRTAFTRDNLRNLQDFQTGGRYAADVSKLIDRVPDVLGYFVNLGYDPEEVNGMLTLPPALQLIYQHYHTRLDAANLIDNVPLSETELIHFYDPAKTKNYLHWLAQANTVGALEAQDFGSGKAAPNTLLYLQLRRALLLQLHKASLRLFRKHGVDLGATKKAATFHNIRPEGDLGKYEVLKGKIGTVAPDHEHRKTPVGDYLLTAGTTEDEAQFLHEMRDALAELAQASTAELERCFTEHMDICSYRLDAWETAFFRLRLLAQRRALTPESRPQRKKGIYLGAYGWLENVSAASRPIEAENVPAALKPADSGKVVEYPDNGGFVHAPSLNHASAAALLRSGYLSHLDADNPEKLAVNLSSERVRRALFMLQGLQNGQTMEALLGYQFERGLHDRASADTSLAKLNSYIYSFRAQFPYAQHQIKQQGVSDATKNIPANNVVNGKALAEHQGAFPYGATDVAQSVSAGERLAIEQEKERLADTLDAVKDLLLAESTYQLVQGNFDRASAVINALKDAKIPPVLDVIGTPRGNRFSFTNRVTIQFEKLDASQPGSNPWTPIPMTPRAKMEAGLNKWLGDLLGDPAELVFQVAHLDGANEVTAKMTVKDISVQPIDLVYMCGNELNTGEEQRGAEPRTAASELERRVAFAYRQNNALDDDVAVRIRFTKPNGAGKITLGRLLPLLRMLKSLITDSRYLHAQDFDPPSKESLAKPDNPKGFAVADLQGRVSAAAALLKSQLDRLWATSITAHVDGRDYTDLKSVFEAMQAAKVGAEAVTFTLGNPTKLQSELISLSAFGDPNSFPQLLSLATHKDKAGLLDQATLAARRADRAYSEALDHISSANAEPAPEGKVEAYVAAGKALLGADFNVLPQFIYANEADIAASNAGRTELLKYAKANLGMAFPADEWLQSVAFVRPKVARWDYIRTLKEALSGTALEVKPIQLPYRATDSWLAVEFPHAEPGTNKPFNITNDTLSIVIHGDAAFRPGSRQAGLLVDDWTENIPTKEELTGITFNYDQPNACAPQALLLAVPPQETGSWAWDDLIGILNDTLQRAKRRAVEPMMLDKLDSGLIALLPAIVADFSTYDLNFALDFRTNVARIVEQAPIKFLHTT